MTRTAYLTGLCCRTDSKGAHIDLNNSLEHLRGNIEREHDVGVGWVQYVGG